MFKKNKSDKKSSPSEIIEKVGNVLCAIIFLIVIVFAFKHRVLIVNYASNLIYQNLGKPYYSMKYKLFSYPIAYVSKSDKNLLSDYPITFFWINLKRAKNNSALAENNLGIFFEKNKKIDNAQLKTYYWYDKAASDGLPIGQYNLARMYLTGIGLGGKKNKIGAYAWLHLAALEGLVVAKHLQDYVVTQLNNDQQQKAMKVYQVLLRKYGNKWLLRKGINTSVAPKSKTSSAGSEKNDPLGIRQYVKNN